MTRKRFQRIYWITMFVLFLPFVFPLFEVANRVTPIVLGLPFTFFWICLWTIITFLVILVFYWIDPDNKEG